MGFLAGRNSLSYGPRSRPETCRSPRSEPMAGALARQRARYPDRRRSGTQPVNACVRRETSGSWTMLSTIPYGPARLGPERAVHITTSFRRNTMAELDVRDVPAPLVELAPGS